MKVLKILSAYRLGKHILDNLKDIDNFNAGLIQKTSKDIPEYLGTVHCISYVKKGDKYYKEINILE